MTSLEQVTFLKTLEGQTITAISLSPGGKLLLNANPVPDWFANTLLSAMRARVPAIVRDQLSERKQTAREELATKIDVLQAQVADLRALRDSLNGG